ncbi:MAG: hypothetical protein WKG03_13685 [Telluria sp.]
MEFNIKMASTPDVSAIEHAIRIADPSAQVDLDPQGLSLRVATLIDATELVTLISQAGTSVTRQVTQAPSICCGGCGG